MNEKYFFIKKRKTLLLTYITYILCIHEVYTIINYYTSITFISSNRCMKASVYDFLQYKFKKKVKLSLYNNIHINIHVCNN